MDALTAWAIANPAVARLLWVLVLVLATLLVWLFFFCCYSWNQRSSPSLERYLAVMVKHSESKAPTQRKKKPKEKTAACVQPEEAVVKDPPCPAVKKRRKRPLKAGLETVTAATSQKINRQKHCYNQIFFARVHVDQTAFIMDIFDTMEEVKDRPKRRPLVRAASEESSSDLSSISYTPSPGDTLPWNLPKHHRIKRSKSASENVLDPADRAVIRIAGTLFT
ncbi:hypothetical protein PBY51_004836 [Eleginops maclovinus]|uniref:Uncharacterized protein n=1 Tax=Eleginops maclovinus TaxID=56733 RepID=A0AAN7X7A1_ELEMC|nr:hypothetical protein PBY51_004836 [Eleginops maclovinus]